MTQLILFNVTNGLIIGAFYVLMALGLSLILNLSNVINFAHGNFLALGGYLAFTLSPALGYWGALAGLAAAHRGDRPRRRASDDPSRLQPRSRLQPAAHLRVCLRHAGCRALCMGSQPPAAGAARFSVAADQRRPVLHHLVSRLHGGDRHRRRLGLFAFLRYTRVGLRIRAGTLDLETVASLGVNVSCLRTFNFALGCLLAGLSGVLAAGQIGLNPNMGDDLLMPSFIAIIVGGVGSLTGTLFGGLADRRGGGADHRVLSGRQRGGDLCHHDPGPAYPPARLDGRGRNDVMSTDVADRRRPARQRPFRAGRWSSSGRFDRGAVLAAAARRLYRARRTRAGVRPGGDGAQSAAGIHRRAELRSCRLFRARCLRRRSRRCSISRTARRSPCWPERCSAAWPARCSAC